jgi:hypothetical protein
VEADQEQINLTRFELTLPEKRQFFLEGQEQFNQRFPNRYPTFYSRRIADITTGGKLLGKQGPWSVSFISAESTPSGTDSLPTTASAACSETSSDDRASPSWLQIDDSTARTRARSALIRICSSGRTFSMSAQAVKTYGPFGHGTMAFLIRPSYDSSTGPLPCSLRTSRRPCG